MSAEENNRPDLTANPLLLVLSGLSGAGKDTVLTRLKQSGFAPERIITITTRARRTGESEGEPYHFVSEEEFRQTKAAGKLLESANVYGHWYGVPREPVRQALESGKDVIIKVDVQGAVTIRKIVPGAVFIFLAPPSTEELVSRLRQRRTETKAELDRRIKTAGEELDKLPAFDYVVINREGEVDRAVADIKAIYRAEKCRVRPREVSL